MIMLTSAGAGPHAIWHWKICKAIGDRPGAASTIIEFDNEPLAAIVGCSAAFRRSNLTPSQVHAFHGRLDLFKSPSSLGILLECFTTHVIFTPEEYL